VAWRRRGTAEDYSDQAQRLFRERDYPGSLAAADQALGLDPEHAMACHHRGWALSELGRHAEALAAFRRALALDASMTYVQYKIALELSFLRRNAEALRAAEEAIRLMPGDSAPEILRGAALFDLARYPEALHAFSAVLDREPDSAQLWFNRAQVLRRLGRPAAAVADYDQALRRAPDLAVAREQLAVTLVLTGRFDEALAQFAAGPPTATADVWAAAIAWHRGDPLLAHQWFQRAAGRPAGRSRWESVNLQAVTACALGEPDAAAALLRDAADEANGSVQDILCGLYRLLSEPPLPGIARLRAIALGS
jgi:Flp pilus assembly protein TadD